MTFKIWTLCLFFCLLKNKAVAESESPPGNIPALVGDNLTRSPVNGIVDLDQTIQCFLNEKIPEEVQWFTVDQEGVETEIQTSDGVTNVKAEDPAITYRCKIDENTYADFKVRSAPSSHPPVTTITDDSEEELSESPDSSSVKSSVNFRVNKFAKSISVVEGEDLRVECKITLVTNSTIDIKKDLVFKWYKYKIAEDTDSYVGTLGNCSEENQDTQNWEEIIVLRKQGDEPHINLLESEGIPNKKLKIEDASRLEDRRALKCVVYMSGNPSNCSESAFFVRIRDKYAALWPFIGIVSEVFVICLVIFICERRRAATAKDDLDDDEDDLNGTRGLGGTSGNSSCRQRGNKSN